MTIQILLLVFVLLVLARVGWRYLHHDIRGRELVIWGGFWLAVGAAVAVPRTTDIVAQWVGVERGADLLVYVSVLTLFYVVFRIMVRLERLERTTTTLTRTAALRSPEPPVADAKTK